MPPYWYKANLLPLRVPLGVPGGGQMVELQCQRLWPSLYIPLRSFCCFWMWCHPVPLLWANSSHTVYDLVFHGGLPQQNGLGLINTILSFMSHGGSKNEGHWVSVGHTQPQTSLSRCGSQMKFCLLPESHFFPP